MRLLTADVIAIRERVEELSVAPAVTAPPERPPEEEPANVRLNLINHKRVGDEMIAKGLSFVAEWAAENWTNSVVDYMSGRISGDEIEVFLNAGGGTTRDRMPDRLRLLGQMIDALGRKVQANALASESRSETGEHREVGMKLDSTDPTDPERE